MHQAAEAIVDLRSRTQHAVSGDDSLSDVMIADDIARADDHSDLRLLAFWHRASGFGQLLAHLVPIEEPAARLCPRL